jgi:uncharacterized lipoprotein YmbA
MIMKELLALLRVTFTALSGLLLTGCLLRTATISPRHFVLTPAPVPADEPSSAPNSHLSVEIGFVKMPAYLLRDSIAVRTGPNEIQYLEDALWAERLDQCFQRTLTVNLSRLLLSEKIEPLESGPDQAQLKLFVTVQQFDVDSDGHGVLIARWRIAEPGGNQSLRSGQIRLDRVGVSPQGNPAAIAKTMSDLTAQFSLELEQSIRGPVEIGIIPH